MINTYTCYQSLIVFEPLEASVGQISKVKVESNFRQIFTRTERKVSYVPMLNTMIMKP